MNSTANSAQHTAGHGLPRRVIFAAAALSERYLNPEVAAYNRSRHAATPRRASFWFSVGRALYRHPRAMPTNYEMAVHRDIGEARAAIAAANRVSA